MHWFLSLSVSAALHCASARGNTNCVDILLKKKAIAVDVVDYSGCTPLFYSVSLGHIETTRALLQRHRCNPNHLDYRLRRLPTTFCVAFGNNFIYKTVIGR